MLCCLQRVVDVRTCPCLLQLLVHVFRDESAVLAAVPAATQDRISVDTDREDHRHHFRVASLARVGPGLTTSGTSNSLPTY